MSIDDGMQWRTRFTNIVLVNNKMYPNDTEIKVTFQPKTNDAQTQNLTFEKYKYFLVKVLQNSMFIQKNEKHYNFFKQFNDKVIDFANRPIDQIVGVTVFSKLDAIGSDYFKIEQVEIESWQGENLRFIINSNAPEWELIQKQKGERCWWTDPGPIFSSFDKNQLTWDEIGFKIKEEKQFTVIKGGV